MLVSFENPGLFHMVSKKARRSPIESSKVWRSCTGWRNPDGDVFRISHMASKSALSRACSSGVIGRLLRGVHQLAERWYTVRVLPGAVGRGLREAATGDWSGALRSAAIIGGFGMAAAGFAVGCLSAAASSRTSSPAGITKLAGTL